MPLSTPVKNVIRLSIPAILAELSSTLMQYIDASMVGSLGKVASASIGLVASSTWLINGIGMACATGFAVQVAQKIGADQKGQART
ncbi:MATE family efflux transporter, partial [Dubosiella newyorkensis]